MQEENQNINNNENSPKEALFKTNLSPLRTYQGDVEKIITDNHVSVTTIAVAEQERKIVEQESGMVVENSNLKNKLFIYLGLFLFISGIIIIGVIFFIKSQKNQENNLSSQTTLINYVSEVDLSFASTTRGELLKKILKEKTDFNKQINSVLYLNFTDNKEISGVSDVLLRIAPFIPQTLVRSLDKKYMFGVYSYDKNETFIILTTKDYGASFAGMLKWENTMTEDFGEIFNLQKRDTNSPYMFTDESIQNKDLRVMKDENNVTILLYSFIDKNTIVITKNESILTHVYDKFINSKMVR